MKVKVTLDDGRWAKSEEMNPAKFTPTEFGKDSLALVGAFNAAMDKKSFRAVEVPTAEHMDRAINLAFNTRPRVADQQVMALTSKKGGSIEEWAEYIWDHWMGEPEEPTQQQVVDLLILAINATQE